MLVKSAVDFRCFCWLEGLAFVCKSLLGPQYGLGARATNPPAPGSGGYYGKDYQFDRSETIPGPCPMVAPHFVFGAHDVFPKVDVTLGDYKQAPTKNIASNHLTRKIEHGAGLFQY